MKRFALVTGIGCILVTTTLFAATSLESNWICTTNASSSDAMSDKEADKQLAVTKKSASDAFYSASTNCRDCTKIICELQNN